MSCFLPFEFVVGRVRACLQPSFCTVRVAVVIGQRSLARRMNVSVVLFFLEGVFRILLRLFHDLLSKGIGVVGA